MSYNTPKSLSKLFLSFFNLFFIVLIFYGCNDQPTNVGYQFIDQPIKIYTDTTSSKPIIGDYSNLNTKMINLYMGNINIGQYNGHKSIAVIRFIVPDSLSSLTVSKIISAKVYLRTNAYIFGSQSNVLSFSAYKVSKLITPYSRYDSLFPNQAVFSQYFDYGKVLGNYKSNNLSQIDTVTNFINFDLDPNLVVDWCKYGADTILRAKNYGIALLPNPDCNVIRQFKTPAIGDTTTKYPYLQIKYIDKSGMPDSAIFESSLNFTWSDSPEPDKYEMAIQGLVSRQFTMNVDLSAFDKLTAFHIVQLELTADTNSMKYNTWNMKNDSMISVYNALDSNTVPLNYIIGYKSALHKNKYIFYGFASFFDRLIRTESKGKFIFSVLRTAYEGSAIDPLYFYTSDCPDINSRPKFRMVYSKRNKIK
ncbi:MAG: hypothetical protein NT007_08900 [Candidatus Kapabacteria bacterium]|nr:hypothetical protein [Candidatus Kapabacteria bacterium]